MKILDTIIAAAVVLLALAFATVAPLAADVLRLNAEQLMARSVTRHLCLADSGGAIELQRGVVHEDDGPAAGYSYLPNVEKLLDGVQIRKELIVPAPQAKQASLLVGGRGELSARINAKPVKLVPLGQQGNYWQAYRIPPDVLRAGKNEFVLSGSGSVWIARDDEFAAGSATRKRHPNRSSKSLDAGKTWNDSRLGTNNDIDGEYYVRLFLDQHQPEGSLTLGVVDAGNLAGKPIGAPVTSVGPIRIVAEVPTGSNNAVTLRARTGTSFAVDQGHWSDWLPVKLGDGVIRKPAGRYLQVEVRFASDDPRSSPMLQTLTISASPQKPADWTEHLRVVKFDNPQIVRSSIPFQYEPLDRAELSELRRQFDLDKVVAGAETEFELIERLAAWSATRWKKMHLKDSYPPYNALEILKTHEDGTPIGGFCQQYNVVFLQACESFGLVGRLVSIGPGNRTGKIRGGHETVEIWSNEYRKWVYIDGNTAWYAVDQATKQPLSLYQLRQRQIAALRGEDHDPIQIVKLATTTHQWPDLRHWPPFIELRLIPRSNFLQANSPLPLNQGMRGWFWTGHYVWTDDIEPARSLYPHRVEKRGNFEWTLNQAQIVFEAQKPGVLGMHIDTQTPGFQQFVRRTDSRMEPLPAIADWQLQPGPNRIDVMAQNLAGRNGPVTTVELEWSPP